MALVLSNQGEQLALEAFLNKTAGQDLSLRLFQNNYTPVEASIETDFTVATFTGYSSVTLTGASWTVTPGAPTSASYAQQTFTSTAGAQNQSIYGYYLIQTTSGKYVWGERFTDGPYVIVNNGDQIKVTPVITAD